MNIASMSAPIEWLQWTGVHMSIWKLIGLTGAAMFGTRWLVQFAASRRARKSVIPKSFWIMSLIGSGMTLSYFLFSPKQDAVGVMQNFFPALSAIYGLWLDARHGRESRDACARALPSTSVAQRTACAEGGSGSVLELPGGEAERTRRVSERACRVDDLGFARQDEQGGAGKWRERIGSNHAT